MTVKEYVENVTVFEFEICGYFSGWLNIRLKKEDGKRTVSVEPVMRYEDEYKAGERILTEEEWTAFFTKIFEECGVMKYSADYRPVDIILDGEQWNLHIEFANRRAKNSRGSNEYPATFDALIEAIDSLAKK